MFRDKIFKLTLNKKLIAMMLFLSLSLISILVFLYYQSEKLIYNEFERQTSELSKSIQIGLEEATSGGLTDEKRLQGFLNKLNPKGVKEISVISTSDRIISSTNPKDVGKWITKSKKELIFKAELGQPVTGEEKGGYNVMIPVISGEKHMGYIYLTLNTEDFSVFLQTSAMRRIIAASIIFGMGTVLAVFLARRYTKPIEEVVTAAQRVALGDLNQELRTKRKDEIGDLARSFNYMVKKLQEERDLTEKLRKAEHLAGIGQFAQNIAHEIKNPLNFINLSIDHIKEVSRPSDPDKAEKFDSLIHNMKGEIQRVSRFTESFLEFGKPFELNRRETDMQKLIEDVIELVAAKARQENIDIRKQYGAVRTLHVDPEFIKTCIYNIIINALEAMHGGGVLLITTKEADAKFCLKVEDTGTGVPQHKMAKIFEPFFTTKVKGLGLGLSFTHRIIKEHGGKVLFESTEGKGSIMTIFLPIDKGY
ncbi:MAG TPA: two-component sensor histidine kinase [Nitrospiraceae bacterium]|nr:two-component sensor histidine kinase [Nitrospiraceae bacterium]